MSTFTAQPVLSGFVPNPQGDLLAAVTAITYVKKLFLFNTGVLTEQVDLFLLPSGGSASQFATCELGPDESADVIEGGDSIILGVGDAIQGVSTDGGVVTFNLTSVQEA